MRWIVLIMVIFMVISCTQNQESVKKVKIAEINDYSYIATMKSPTNFSLEVVNITPYNFRGDFSDISFIHFYGDIDKEKIMSLIYTINYSYFVGIDSLDIVHTKFSDLERAGTNNGNAFYTPESEGYGSIEWYFEDGDSELTKHDILSELKHHWFWVNGYKWSSIEESHRIGCPAYLAKDPNTFSPDCMITPLDKDYGFIY